MRARNLKTHSACGGRTGVDHHVVLAETMDHTNKPAGSASHSSPPAPSTFPKHFAPGYDAYSGYIQAI